MAGMYGADVEQLRALARQFDQLADRLDASRIQVGNAIRVSVWVGPFAVRFRMQWESEHSRRIAAAAQLLRENARKLRTNADEQERASAPGGGGGFPGILPGLWPGGWNPFLPGHGSLPGPGYGLFPGPGYGFLPGGGWQWPAVPRWIVDASEWALPRLEDSYDWLKAVDTGIGVGQFISGSPIGKLPGVGIVTSGYELIRGIPDTIGDLGSGDLSRIGGAIVRNGYTVATAIPVVGLVDAGINIGAGIGSNVVDFIYGPGEGQKALKNIADAPGKFGDWFGNWIGGGR